MSTRGKASRSAKRSASLGSKPKSASPPRGASRSLRAGFLERQQEVPPRQPDSVDRSRSDSTPSQLPGSEHDSVRRPQHHDPSLVSPRPPTPPVPNIPSNAIQVGHIKALMDTLCQAGAEIQRERQVSADLAAENRRLKTQVAELEYLVGSSQGDGALQQKNAQLARENAVLQNKVRCLEALLEKMQLMSMVNDLQQQQQGQQQQQDPPHHHHHQSPPPPADHPPDRQPFPWELSPDNPAPPSPQTRLREVSTPPQQHGSPTTLERKRGKAEKRLRRALAPPPTQASMGVLVDSMVEGLRQVTEEKGIELPFTKKGECLYLIGNKNRRLAVHSGKLVVRVGGGYEDIVVFLENLSRQSHGGRSPQRRTRSKPRERAKSG
eukprot:Sspe_Gene.58435::Locus_32040_Transcript_2_2_Confidence_0.400_Length_1374::g.58435::m.58435